MAYRYRPPTSLQFSVPGFTPAVKRLIIITACVYFVQTLAAAGLPLFRSIPFGWFALSAAGVLSGAVWQPFTYLFLHAGLGHIFWNMFGLWMFGTIVEGAIGARRFYWLYFVSGIGAGIVDVVLHLILRQNMLVPTVGASGAIFGVLLAFALLFPDQPVFMFPIPVTIKAKWLVLGYGVLEFLFAVGSADNVSHVAHLGGMLFAFLYLKGELPLYRIRNQYNLWKRRRLQRRFEVYMSKRDRHSGDRWVH